MSDPHAHGEHATIGTYVKVAVILTVVTALEFSVIYIRALTPILVPLLLVLSAGKFAAVIPFFLPPRYYNRRPGPLAAARPLPRGARGARVARRGAPDADRHGGPRVVARPFALDARAAAAPGRPDPPPVRLRGP